MKRTKPAKFVKILISLLKFKFLQILLGDKNATSICSKTVSALIEILYRNYHAHV